MLPHKICLQQVVAAIVCIRSAGAIEPTASHAVPREEFLSLVPNDIDGSPVPFKNFADKVFLITNVASECGATAENYNGLTALDKTYGVRGLAILAFPCNQFGGQEPGSPEQIKNFAGTYDAKFKIMEKVNVNGPQEHPVFKVLKHGGEDIKWNFYSKFIVSCWDTTCTIQRYDNVLPKALIPAFEHRLQGDAQAKPSRFVSLLFSIGFIVCFVLLMQYCLNGAKGKNLPKKKRR
eukprot:gnl/MRDRNA2_/MRDRNA2_35523_c0_seq1.p1 gnl/MRDRNA2_/MRDRNA2_35523_c0~~gnl/MRDRNA2_/MRDRNA2_35523_c0_seq1.p1  ORF type:complete len:235 (+),score=36.00 gnl/MRDRNA2_/MRDRNA2_35523_c0_seq1:79-783(+)